MATLKKPATPKAAPSAIATAFDAASAAAERSVLALWVFGHPNIKLATTHVSTKVDTASARSNTIDTFLLMDADRSKYHNAPGGDIALSIQMLRGMLELATTYQYVVSEIAGGSHGKNSRHYVGVAFDVVSINGAPVSAKNVHAAPFMRKCRSLGATEVLGPGHVNKTGEKDHEGHVHAAWPRTAK
jgi:zinc D-Ala-D-Ala carboxypeptidase